MLNQNLKIMLQLFYEGGILFMSILTLCLLIMLILAVYVGLGDTVIAAALRYLIR